MPAKPTWQEVADIAAKVDGAEPGMKGICLRGQPGWGQLFAPLTTVVNTFGGTWFDKDWNPQGRRPGVQGGGELLRRPGARPRREGRTAGRLHRVPQQPRPGQRGHVVRRHLGRRLARGRRLAVQGQVRLRARPRGQDRLGRLALRLVLVRSSRRARRRTTPGSSSRGPAARSTRTSSASEIGWTSVPAGKRASTYENAEYLKVASAFAEPTKAAIEAADPENPGVAAPTRHRHPVRRHPRVPGPRHPGQPGRQLGDRRQDLRGRRPEARPGARRGRRRALPDKGTESHASTRATTATIDRRRHQPAARAEQGPQALGRLGPQGAPAARADLHHPDDPAAVRRDDRHLVHELERLLPGGARLRRRGQLRPGLHRHQHPQGRGRHDPADRVGGAHLPAAGPRHRAAPRPQVPGSGHRPHDDDHAVPHRAGGRRPAVEARALQPGVRPVQRPAQDRLR